MKCSESRSPPPNARRTGFKLSFAGQLARPSDTPDRPTTQVPFQRHVVHAFTCDAASRKAPLSSPRYEPHFRRGVETVCRLGPYPVACLLEEISAGRDLREAVAKYASLAKYGELICSYGGDKFPERIFAIVGGGAK